MANVIDSYQAAQSVTPSDSANIPVTTALYVGGAGSGNLTVTMRDGKSQAFAGLTANTVLRIAVTQVKSTGTDVTNIVALY